MPARALVPAALVLSYALAAVCVAAPPGTGSQATGPAPIARLTPESPPEEIAQWAVNYVHCHLGSADPRVLDVAVLASDPFIPTPERPTAMVLLGGGLRADGFGPDARGWYPYGTLVIDLPIGGAVGLGGSNSLNNLLRGASVNGWSLLPSGEWLQIRAAPCASPGGPSPADFRVFSTETA
jgi:hypothetical protein